MPSKKPYSFLAMLQDILAFAADTLVVHGRLSFWMPTANDEELEIPVPSHPCLELISVCVQVFNKCEPWLPLLSWHSPHPLQFHASVKMSIRSFLAPECPFSYYSEQGGFSGWLETGLLLTTRHLSGSRRLITYQRLPDESVSRSAYQAYRERQHVADTGTTADELNPFRRCYFRKFEAEE